MLTLRHPSELGLRQVYRQARKVARGTSRASNPDWYRNALELDRQWHILLDGGGNPVSCIYDRKKNEWFPGPEVNFFPDAVAGEEAAPVNSADIGATLDEVIRNREFGGRVRSLGVIVHVADELAVAELAPDQAMEVELDELRHALEASPRTVLGDSQADERHFSWKLLPYWGVGEGDRRAIAIQISKRRHHVLEAMRRHGEQQNVPIIASALSAPLEALQLAPLYLRGSSGKGDILLLQYRRFSTLVVLNQSGELMQLRSLLHRGGMNYPQAPGDLLLNAAASMNLEAPVVHVIPMGAVDQEPLKRELALSPVADFGVEVRYEDPAPQLAAAIPGHRMEMLLACPEAWAADLEATALAETITFQELRAGWAAQDFAGMSAREREMFPSRQELILLKLGGKAKLLLTIAAFGVAGWAGYQGALLARAGGFELSEVDVQGKRLELQMLTDEEERVGYWESMMAARSEGWVGMELVLQLVPEDASILITSCKYDVTGESAANKAKGEIAFNRKWQIEGYARQGTMTQLTQLGSTAYMEEQFNQLAEKTGMPSWSMEPETRDVKVTVQQTRREYPANGVLPANLARQYQTAFELSIVQTFSDQDELALKIKPYAKPQPAAVAQ